MIIHAFVNSHKKRYYHKKGGITLRITKIKIKKQKVRREPYVRKSKSEENLLGKRE